MWAGWKWAEQTWATSFVTATVTVIVRHVLEARELAEIGQMDGAGGAVALLGDDDLGLALRVGILLAVLVLVVVAVAMDEGDHVGILLDGSGFAEIGKHRLLVASALLRGSAELGECDDRDVELFRERLQSA